MICRQNTVYDMDTPQQPIGLTGRQCLCPPTPQRLHLEASPNRRSEGYHWPTPVAHVTATGEWTAVIFTINIDSVVSGSRFISCNPPIAYEQATYARTPRPVESSEICEVLIQPRSRGNSDPDPCFSSHRGRGLPARKACIRSA